MRVTLDQNYYSTIASMQAFVNGKVAAANLALQSYQNTLGNVDAAVEAYKKSISVVNSTTME